MGALIHRVIQVFEELFGARFDARGQVASAAASIPLLEATVVEEDDELRVAKGGGQPEMRPDEPYLLSVDDAGQFLLVPGERVSLGHLRCGHADLLFLADVGAVHAHLERHESLSGGPVWRFVPCAGERSYVNEVEVAAAMRLTPGDRVRLGENLAFVVHRPDPASHSVVLELEGGAECAGARHVVLFGDGEGGRLRIGAAAHRHVRVPNLEHEITLVHVDGRLFARCETSVQGSEESGTEGFSLPVPPPQRFHLSFGKPQGSRPPFGLAIEPSELAEHRTGGAR